MNTDVMVDNETGDTIATAVILSIGAVRFDQYSDSMEDDGFYTVVDIDSNLRKGRTISGETLRFWMRQPSAAQAVFFEPNTVSLEEALVNFAEWVEPKREKRMWSMGAGFDVPQLEHAYTSFGMDIPWVFWKSRCMRHHKELPGAKIIYDSVERLGTHHNALDDAIHQARAAQQINKGLFPKFFRGA